MHYEDKIKQFRKEMKAKLKEWIPNNDSLIDKELKIFDRVMNRREFIQTTSIATAYALLYQGCSDSPPSRWPVQQDMQLSDAELLSVTKTSKMVIDADLIDTVVEYSPLKALGSTDALDVQKSGILESFNPHLMTVESTDLLENGGLKLQSNNVGSPEIVHLTKENISTNSYLQIYEHVINTSENSLFKTSIELPSSSEITFDKLVASNGSYHNHTLQGVVYSQKMIALANIENSVTPDLRVYYQSSSSKVLEPGAVFQEDQNWVSLDILEHFNYAESYNFSSYAIVDLDNYSDAIGNRFIYGTLRFDNLYNYGFVVAFTSLSASKPKVSFFTPKFLSVHGSEISDLQTSFDTLGIDTNGFLFQDLSIFKEQKFLPFSSLVATDDTLSNSVIFSFECFDVQNKEVIKKDETYDLTQLSEIYNSMMKRYMLRVDISGGGVVYLLETYENTPSFSLVNDILHFSFDTSDLSLPDLYRDIYKSDDIGYGVALSEIQSSYVRGVVNNGLQYHIILASGYYDPYSMGIAQKSIKLDIETLEVNELLKAKASFDETIYDVHSYKSLWFDEVVDNSNSILESVVNNGGKYDCYITQNQQGVLKGYFLLKLDESNFLLNFNEQGQNPEPTTEVLYNYQNFDTLYTQIQESSTLFFPPLPVATDVVTLFHNKSVAQEEELLYITMRDKKVDETSQKLVENEDASLLSYSNATYDLLSGVWSTQELSENLTQTQHTSNVYIQPRHIVHMYTHSVYDYPSVLEESIYVEVRFSKAVVVSDLTHIDQPKTYRAKRASSIFLKPDRKGKITLEIQNGLTREELFNGSSMLYRLLDVNDLSLDQKRPLAMVQSSSTTTTSFMHCNISFKLFNRVSTDNANRFQEGVLQSEMSDPTTAYDILHAHVKDSQRDNIVKVTDIYTKLSNAATANNEANFVSMALASSDKISPMLFLYNDVMLDGVTLDKSKFSKWIHHAISTIKHAVHRSVQTLSKKIKSALEKLVPEIDDLLSNPTISLDGVLNALSVIVNKIVSFVDHIYITYFEPFWDFLKGFFDFKSAFIIGEEFQALFREQMLEDSSNPNNGYSVVKEQTKTLQENIDLFFNNVKQDVDNKIDDYFYTNSTMADQNTKQEHDRSSMQKNSVKYNHGMDTVSKIYKNVVDPQIADSPIDSNLFTCNADLTVEQLLSCVMKQENQTFLNTINQKTQSNNKVFHNIADQGVVGDQKNNMATLLKQSMNLVIDEVDTLTDGIIQVPLAFLNGSSSINLAKEELDAGFQTVFEVLGLLFFSDPDKFQTLDDVGYFLLGYSTFFQLSTLDPQTETLVDTTQTRLDYIKYIKDGTLRDDFNKIIANVTEIELSDIIAFCDTIDSILMVSITISDFFIDNLSISKFNLMQRVMQFFMLMRIVMRVPKLIRHVQYFNSQDTDKQVLALFAMMADIFHIATLIVEILRVKVYGYDDIENGTEAGGVFSLLTILHAMLFFMETFLELIAVFDLGEGTSEKKEIERMKKSLEFLASIPSAILDALSGNSEAENEMSGVVALKTCAYVILTLCYGTIGLVTIEYKKSS